MLQGCLQVTCKDLPLSIQEAYEKFLNDETVTLQQYQVSLTWRYASHEY